jgi:hypothetical protein
MAIKAYLKLISSRIYEPIEEYLPGETEVHHIIPKSLIIIPWLSDRKFNLVRLYTYEHLLAHYFLALIFPHSKSVQAAFYMMSNLHGKLSYSKVFARAQAYQKAKIAFLETRTNKTYNEIYGNKKAQEIKKKQRKKKLDKSVRIIPVDKRKK